MTTLEALIREVLDEPVLNKRPGMKKAKPPKGFKACRCGKHIPKEWRMCPRCIDFESDDWFHQGHERRFMIAAVCREINQ